MNKSRLEPLRIPFCVYRVIGTRRAAVFELRLLLLSTNTPGAPTAPFVA